MNRNPVLTAVFLTTLLASSRAIGAQQTPPPPDNTTVNKKGGPTADQQAQTKADLALTRRIRQAILKDKTLSITAHNCKVITQHGTVTLRGPVNSVKEKDTIDGIAVKIAGTGKVTDELVVKSGK
jgi:hyperosmotically inducible protein